MAKYTADEVREMLWQIIKAEKGPPLRQHELAKRIGVSTAFLNSTLKGNREPQGKILDFLGLRPVVTVKYERASDNGESPK